MASSKVALLGGTGFLGRAIIRRLLAQGNSSIRVVTRSATRVPTSSGLVEVYETDVVKGGISSIKGAIEGCDKVVNLIGLLYETPSHGSTFESAHVGVATALASQLTESQHLVHISAIGADLNSRSKYASTKARAEELVSGNGIILRPSIVYGPGDGFFVRFADMTRWSPFLPLVGGGTTRYQPVHVDDVALAVVHALELKDVGTYELGGEDVRDFRELMQMTLRVVGRKRALLSLPYSVAAVQGAVFEQMHRLVPGVAPLLTSDQVELLKYDNVVMGKCGFKQFGLNRRGCKDEDIAYIRRL